MPGNDRASSAVPREQQVADYERLMQNRSGKIAQSILRNQQSVSELHFTHGRQVVERYNVKGALQMACDGYEPLFADWLPLYRSLEGDEWRLQKTLLRIMSTLDDTCVIHRAGYDRAQEVKREAAALLEIPGHLKEMCSRYAAEGISPGGAADMLALTIFIDSILN